MRIKMIETVQGSLDGVTVQELAEGQEYNTVGTPVGDRLAQYHVNQGVAVYTPDSAPAVGVTLAEQSH